MTNLIVYSKIGNVFIMIAVLAILIFLTYYLIKQVLKERDRIKEERNLLVEGLISTSEMNSIMAMYMNRLGEEARFGLIYLDLDKFEDFIMAFGDKEANEILKTVAIKIKELLPSEALISNYTSDEFLIFFPQKYKRSEVVIYANEILESFREQTEILGSELVDLTTSVAVAYYPHHGESINSLLQSLSLAIYQVKKQGGNSLKIYSSDLSSDEEHLEYYYEVKKAIANKEFHFHYQPIYNITTGNIFAYEALIRWEHPEHGMISPYKFINILEQSGDIHWVGKWGFETLINKHLELKSMSSLVKPKLSMNLSPRQLMSENLVSDFAQLIRKNRIDTTKFILEIGEFALFERQQVIIDNITKLKKLGFEIAVDGFGIDIATFEKLSALDIDTVKVDYSFIEEESFAVNKHMEILKEFTKKDGMVIVQGIEDESDELRIKEYNIEYAQGYYYSKPLNDGDMIALNNKNIDKVTK